MNKILKLCSTIVSIIIIFTTSCNKHNEINIDVFNQVLSYRNIGLAKIEDELFSDAARAFNSFIELAPLEASGYANLGWSYLQSPGKLDSAKIMLLRAVELSPNNSDILYLTAKIYELTGRSDKAKEVLINLLKNRSDHILSLYQLSEYYQKTAEKNDRQKSEELLKNIIDLIPGNVPAHLKLIELSIKNNH